MRKAKTKKKEKPLLHFLIGMSVHPGMHFHCYLMCTDKRAIPQISQLILKELEKRGLEPFAYIILVTPLDEEGTELVRACAELCVPGQKELLEKATDYHYSGWMMSSEHPMSQRLMGLH